MRPTRSKDIHASIPGPTNAAPTSFFLATEADNNFGIRSLQDSIIERPCTHDKDLSDENFAGLRPRPTAGGSSNNSAFPSASHSLTSLSQASHGPASSIPSSPKSTSTRSFRPSDEDLDQGGSHAVTSSEEEEDVEHHTDVQESALQLIMPSIRMPSRRPFTDRGKSIGHLKVLIAGDSGVGKTSLIRSIVQVCEDVVHVDPTSSITSSVTQTSQVGERTRHGKAMKNSMTQISEICASTKAYPQWWVAADDNIGPRRRKSMGDTILERNICFIDTPGYSQGLSITEGIWSVVSYIEEQLARPFSAAARDEGELLAMLSGSGGTQVDVVLYMIDQEVKPADLEFLEHLAKYSCVIPLIAKADTLGSEELKELKSSVVEQLSKSGVAPFELNPNGPTQSPYAVCSAPSNELDASILVSDYVQPLLPSELGILIDRLFDQDNIAHMRHASARKLLDSCKVDFSSSFLASSSLAMLRSSFLPNPAITSQRTQLARHTARLEDLTKQEERMAQIRLAKWADDMRKRMRDERGQFEELYQTERAAWLSQRLGECAGEKAPLRSTNPSGKGAGLPEFAGTSACAGITNFADPLGLVRWNEAMRRRGWIAFQIVGSFGVVGAVAIWAARTWGVSLDGSGWSLGRWVRA